jgi:hypothetical protein
LKLDGHDRVKRTYSPAPSDEAVGRITASPYNDDALADALAEGARMCGKARACAETLASGS